MRLIDADEYKDRLKIYFCSSCNSRGDTMCAACRINDALEALDEMPTTKETDEYRWHDLRKNPDDLPEDGEDIVCLFFAKGFDSQLSNTFKYHSGNLKNDEKFEHIAWKYIEPFEG